MEATVNGGFESFDKLRTGKLAEGKADVWRRRIDAQRASGLSVRAWCAGNGAHEHSFYWWRSRLGLSPRQRPLPMRKAKTTPPAFARVILNGTQPAAAEPPVVSGACPEPAEGIEPLRLRFAGERELILPASMPLEQVARLVHLIEAET